MTQANTISLSLSPSSAVGSSGLANFVGLEQVAAPLEQQYVSIAAVYRMWLRALSGFPAGLYRPQGCPLEFSSEGVAHTWLDFYALPSHPDLQFTLSSNIGDISTAIVTSLPRQRDIIFEMSDFAVLDFYINSATLHWDTPCYLPDGGTTPAPQPTIDETSIRLPQAVFGVARLNAVAYALRYRLDIYIEKGENRITNLEPIITAAWTGTDGKTQTEQLSLEVPDCVKHGLELCDGDLLRCIHYKLKYPPPTIHVSTCDGSVLRIRRGDPEEWCVQVGI